MEASVPVRDWETGFRSLPQKQGRPCILPQEQRHLRGTSLEAEFVDLKAEA